MAITNKKILIIDDDEFLLDMYVVKFKESGFDVEACRGGEDAILKIKSGLSPGVILLDIVMPGIDGFEVLRLIKKDGLSPDALVIILTNLGQKEDVEKGMRLGANDYIVKAHFTPSEVVKRVLELMENKK